ncbi:hypothetical protein NDI76_04020 [Halogeometricum sp. S1BR25-6]|uniref:Uncharacterized protein n=1 Tax=Halogeometricum salsisoli TaxID=2950536 RepID=A0ABU2GAV9_9EURY|nr:hypothetical protein [Halogeometricum sp. S1BR25-6]MDS0297899.1 hypothetical protein [Halogeometricum sp. S1BR25-6]
MSRDRGQVVLLAAVVVAVALVPMAFAYAQLGYAPGDGTRPAADVDGVGRTLSTAFTGAATGVDGEHRWRNRTAAVDEVRTELVEDIARVERTATDRGQSLLVSYDAGAAEVWAAENCPGGRGRAFGPCRADDGVVVQQRGNDTVVVAAAFDLSVVSAEERTNATVIVRAV